jgi:hypothetical protein
MSFPIKTCVICSQKFELKPDKPGFANRCPTCSSPEADEPIAKRHIDDQLKTNSQANAERRTAIRNLLYRKDS